MDLATDCAECVYVLQTDALRLVHLSAVFFVIGGIFHAHMTTLRSLSELLSLKKISDLKVLHSRIWLALVVLWISGALMIILSVGTVFSAIPDKVLIKISVVFVLTINALFIGSFLIPFLESRVGCSLIGLSLRDKMKLLPFVALSMAGWSVAIMIGSMDVFKYIDIINFIIVIIAVKILFFLSGFLVVIVLHFSTAPSMIR